MIINVVFYELDNKMIPSMKETIDEVLSKISEKYKEIDYSVEKQRLMVSCHEKYIKIITFSYEKIQSEYQAVDKSIISKDSSRSLAVINIGSRSYNLIRKYGKYFTNFPPKRDEEFYIDRRISTYLSEREIDSLFIPYISGEKFSKPALIIDRAQHRDNLDNDCDAATLNRHLKYIEENIGESPKEDILFIQELLSDETVNYQMIGEILFKALYPDEWEKSAENINASVRKRK